jgi:hypothetical protein
MSIIVWPVHSALLGPVVRHGQVMAIYEDVPVITSLLSRSSGPSRRLQQKMLGGRVQVTGERRDKSWTRGKKEIKQPRGK